MLINEALQRSQQGVIYNQKFNSLDLFLFFVHINAGKLNLFNFLLTEMLKIASCAEPWSHVLHMPLEIFLIQTYPADHQSWTKK